jgi:hypothetical protein
MHAHWFSMQAELTNYYTKRIERIQKECKENPPDLSWLSEGDTKIIQHIGQTEFLQCEFALARSLHRHVYMNETPKLEVVPLTNHIKPSQSKVYAVLMHYMQPVESRAIVFDSLHLQGLSIIGQHLILSSDRILECWNEHKDVEKMVNMIVVHMLQTTKHQFQLGKVKGAVESLKKSFETFFIHCCPLFQHLVVHLYHICPNTSRADPVLFGKWLDHAIRTLTCLHQYFRFDSNSQIGLELIRAFQLCRHVDHYVSLSTQVEYMMTTLKGLEAEIIPEKQYIHSDHSTLCGMIQYFGDTICSEMYDGPYSTSLLIRQLLVQMCWPIVVNQWIHKECNTEKVNPLHFMAIVDLCSTHPDIQLGMYTVMMLCYGSENINGLDAMDSLSDLKPGTSILTRLLPNPITKESLKQLYHDLQLIQALGCEVLYDLDKPLKLSKMGAQIQTALKNMKNPEVEVTLNDIKHVIHKRAHNYEAYIYLMQSRWIDPLDGTSDDDQ